MYGFDRIKNKDLFFGSELTQICVGANEIILNFFPDGTSITIFDTQGFLKNNKYMFEPLVNGLHRKIRQIGKTVQKFEVIDNYTAAMLMSDGAEIIFKDDSPNFESVTFQIADLIFVV